MELDQVRKKFKNVKLIVSDVDGTLLDTTGNLHQLTLDKINYLKSKNILFTIATQRVYSSTVELAKELNIDIPLITLNGAYIRDIEGKYINKAAINPKTVQKAIELADKYFVKIALCYDDKIVYTEDNSVIKDFMQRIGTDYELVKSYNDYLDSVVEIIMSGNEREAIKKIQSKLSFPLSYFVTGKYFRSQTLNKVYSLEIRRSGINKKSGMKKLASHLGIKKNQIAVLGDWYNDRELFEFGALNIALQNAVPELKNMADYVTTKSNEEGGVGHFLSQVYDD